MILLYLGIALILLSAIPPRRNEISNEEWDKLNKKAEQILGKEITWKICATE